MPQVRAIMRRRNVRPGAITRHANWRIPIRDWSSFNWQEERFFQVWRRDLALSSLSVGSKANMRAESRVIPRNSKDWLGANVFPGATGTFNSVKRHSRWHSEVEQEARGPASARKKSSRMWRTLETPNFCIRIHSRASESILNIKGALRRPKGNTRSKKYKPRHCMPRSSQSWGCTGIFRNADWTSVLAIKQFGPSFRRILIASSMRTYCKEKSSEEILALTLVCDVLG